MSGTEKHGWLKIVGLGPGPAEWRTPQADAVLHDATDIVGYIPYVAAVPETATARRHPSDNRVELDRARQALDMAASGARVAVVSGGDAGIFGMAAAVFEAMEQGGPAWRDLDVEIIPGMTAFLAAAAKIGAPLGHDFCVMSLSDYLKPWPVIERRLRAVCDGDFALALYNPASKTRREQLQMALDCLRARRAPDTLVMAARNIGRAGEEITVTTLAHIDPDIVDMRTLLMIGSSATRRIARPRGDIVYTPRFYGDAP